MKALEKLDPKLAQRVHAKREKIITAFAQMANEFMTGQKDPKQGRFISGLEAEETVANAFALLEAAIIVQENSRANLISGRPAEAKRKFDEIEADLRKRVRAAVLESMLEQEKQALKDDLKTGSPAPSQEMDW